MALPTNEYLERFNGGQLEVQSEPPCAKSTGHL